MNKIPMLFRFSRNTPALKPTEAKRRRFTFAIFRRFTEKLENWLLAPLFRLLRSPAAGHLQNTAGNQESLHQANNANVNSKEYVLLAENIHNWKPQHTPFSLVAYKRQQRIAAKMSLKLITWDPDAMYAGEWQTVTSGRKKVPEPQKPKKAKKAPIPGSLRELRRLQHYVVGKSKEPIHDDSKLTQKNIFNYLLV